MLDSMPPLVAWDVEELEALLLASMAYSWNNMKLGAGAGEQWW
jgi:hypothetical protein